MTPAVAHTTFRLFLQRGVGGRAVGSSLSLVAPSEDKFHSQLVQQLGLSFETVRMDGRILRESQERVCLASKVATADDSDRQRTRDQQWFQEQARDAGIELESDDEDLIDGSNTRSAALRADVAGSRQRLARLLQQPLQIQRHGKFLSAGGGGSDAMKVQLSTPIVAGDTNMPTKKKTKRRRRK